MSPTRPTRNVLFLIPARGGSKGLPGKNLSLVGGIPLVGRAARLGRAATKTLGPASRVVCSTDDADIAAAAKSWGAEVPFMRPGILASDGARSIDVALHALDTLGGHFDSLVLLQPTSPLTEVDDVLNGIALHDDTGMPVVSVCPAEHPVEWFYTIDGEGRLSKLSQSDAAPHQRQQARAIFRSNGAVYVSAPSALRHDDAFFGRDTRALVMPVERSIDVDTGFDLLNARAILARRDSVALSILGRRIGAGHPCFVIADAGGRHDGDVATAKSLVDTAVAAGADAVRCDAHEFDHQAHRAIISHCQAKGILCLATPSDEGNADVLDSLGLPAFMAPPEAMTNLSFLRHLARKGKPMILSIGGSSLPDVSSAIDAVADEGNRSLLLLQSVDHHSGVSTHANLGAMATLREAFGVPAGFSDRTPGDAIALAAVALGACAIEKPLAMVTDVFGAMVHRIRAVEAAVGGTAIERARGTA